MAQKKRIFLSADIFICIVVSFVVSRPNFLGIFSGLNLTNLFLSCSAFASLAFGFSITTATVSLSLAQGRLGKALVAEGSENSTALSDLVFVYLWGSISSLFLVLFSVVGVFLSDNTYIWNSVQVGWGWLVGMYFFIFTYTLIRLFVSILTLSSFVRVFIKMARR